MNELRDDCDCEKKRSVESNTEHSFADRLGNLPRMLAAMEADELEAIPAILRSAPALAAVAGTEGPRVDLLQELISISSKQRVRIIIEPFE